MKVLLIGDIHLADRPPSSCTESYTEDLFGLLEQVSEVAKAEKVGAIVPLGDIFHIKMPSRNSHKLVREFIEWAQAAPCRVIGVTGNHDLSQDRLDSLWEGQPLGVVFKSGAVEFHRGWVPDLGCPLYVVHWLQDWDAEESVADQAVAEALKDWDTRYDGSVPALLVTHAPFYPPGREPPYEKYSTEKFAAAMGNHGSVASGHIHEPHGEYVVDGVRFCNNGALSRGSLTEYNVSRSVGVTIWDSETGRFEFIPLKAKPADQVFRIAEVTEKKTAQMKLDEFLASVGQTSIAITTTDAVLNHVRSLGLGKDIECIVEELLNEMN